jgi:hypothetical protein
MGNVDSAGNTHAEDLLARPQRFGLDNCGDGDSAISIWYPEQDILDVISV